MFLDAIHFGLLVLNIYKIYFDDASTLTRSLRCGFSLIEIELPTTLSLENNNENNNNVTYSKENNLDSK